MNCWCYFLQEIASAIQIGAKAYLARQYKTIAVVGVVVLVIICFVFSPLVGLGYFIGATLSGIAGYVGMLVSVQANVRTAEASRKGLASGLAVATARPLAKPFLDASAVLTLAWTETNIPT